MNVKVDCVINNKNQHFHLKNKLSGTTFSGHPTATSLFGTLRNIMYPIFCCWRNIPHHNITDLMAKIRKKYKIRCSGDDGIAMSKTLSDA